MSVLLLSNGPSGSFPPGRSRSPGTRTPRSRCSRSSCASRWARESPRPDGASREGGAAPLPGPSRDRGRGDPGGRRRRCVVRHRSRGMVATRDGETVRLRPLDRHPERVERAQGSPVPVLRRPPCGETGRAGVDSPGGIPLGRPDWIPPPSGRPTGAASPTTSTRRRRVFPCSTGWRRRSAGSPRRRLSASSKPARGSPW